MGESEEAIEEGVGVHKRAQVAKLHCQLGYYCETYIIIYPGDPLALIILREPSFLLTSVVLVVSQTRMLSRSLWPLRNDAALPLQPLRPFLCITRMVSSIAASKSSELGFVMLPMSIKLQVARGPHGQWILSTERALVSKC